MKIKTIILEDTKEGMYALRTLLNEHCTNIDIIGEAYTNEEAYDLVKRLKPQLAFLDINLESGTSFDLLKRLFDEDAVDFDFIFFTSHGQKENLVKAIRFSAFDFLNKPVDKNELIDAVDRIGEKMYKEFINTKNQLEMVFETLSSAYPKSKRIAFQLANGVLERVKIEDILWLQTDEVNNMKISNVTRVMLADGTHLKAMKHLGFYKKLLTIEYNFFQISQSIHVNLEYVKSYNSNEKSLQMDNGSTLFASKRNGQKFQQFLKNNEELKHLLEEDSPFTQWVNRMVGRIRGK